MKPLYLTISILLFFASASAQDKAQDYKCEILNNNNRVVLRSKCPCDLPTIEDFLKAMVRYYGYDLAIIGPKEDFQVKYFVITELANLKSDLDSAQQYLSYDRVKFNYALDGRTVKVSVNSLPQ